MPRFFQNARDPVSSYSHFLGAVFSLVGLVVMGFRFFLVGNPGTLTVIACLIFCLSLIALYSASAFYHFVRTPESRILTLRKLDHAMIYVLIAGSYTPLLLTLLPYPNSVIFTSVIWAVALGGIIMKLCWITAPRWLGTGIYLLLGWAILVDLSALAALPVAAIALLVAGGLSYSVGGVIYMLKRPLLCEGFGFHELFHMFVILGSLCHYFLILFYIV